MLTDEQTDRELLELAAKAAGYSLSEVNDMIWSDAEAEYAHWNPLTDDGDAFRLMVKLEIDVFHSDILVRAMHRAREGSSVAVRVNDDRLAAARRAIVRAAVESRKEQPK